MDIFEQHKSRLRGMYLMASPQQRLGVALERMRHADCGPNLLIQTVSAVEGLARALVVNAGANRGEAIEDVYASVRSLSAPALVSEALDQSGRPSPTEVLGGDTWATFQHAVDYRNVLIHECAFLRDDLSIQLIDAASSVFNMLKGLMDTARAPIGGESG